MTTICKYCNEPENKQYRPGLICDTCICFVHLTCLRRQGTPGDLACDVFFDFTCEECSPNNKEVFTRNRFPWVHVILLTLHHLTTNAYGISNHGFFHYKTHICSFIDRNWSILFDPQFKQKKNWVGTIAGSLSVYSNIIFRSGSVVLGETGWWQLQHAFSPAVASHIIQEIARDKPKGRPRGQMALDITLFTEKVTEMGYREYLRSNEEETALAAVDRAPKKRRVDTDYGGSYYDQLDSDSRQSVQSEAAAECSSDGDGRGFDFPPQGYLPPSDSSSMHSLLQPLYYDSDSRSSPRPEPEPEPELPEPEADIKPEADGKPEAKPRKVEEKRELTRESLFSKEPNSLELPWVEQEKYEVQKDLAEPTQYEEVQLLKQVENLIPKVREPKKRAYLHRLKAKLALRRLKRHKHLPIFDIDKAVKVLSGQVPEEPQTVADAERVLDRFQRSYLQDNLCGTILNTNYAVTVLSSVEPASFRSAYSNALLKPYIRRDSQSHPLWLRVTDELLIKANRLEGGFVFPPLDTNYAMTVPSSVEPASFRSAYSNALLKPYIRRDSQSHPLWLRVTDELLIKANRLEGGFVFPPLDTNYAMTVPSSVEPASFRSAYSNALLKPYIRRDSQSHPLWLRVTDELLIKANRLEGGFVFPPLDTNYAMTVPSSVEPASFRSAYSNALLKPYIRRDSQSHPLWLRVTDELLIKANRNVKDYKPPPHATIDYSYVQPHHIAAVNNLCAQFFWPGVDLTEALEYPEFSCVVTYKRLIVGCAFLVPADAAYISFILVRPEWRRAGLATFMLYHLLQTCTGKDVTLHVSPTNPAIFLYQKFGFKVEELVQDFYEKYYDIDYKGCRHALFLRLTR